MTKTEPPIYSTQRWLIISWTNKQNDPGKGFLLEVVVGSEDDAKFVAHRYVPIYSPVGIVREIT